MGRRGDQAVAYQLSLLPAEIDVTIRCGARKWGNLDKIRKYRRHAIIFESNSTSSS